MIIIDIHSQAIYSSVIVVIRLERIAYERHKLECKDK